MARMRFGTDRVLEAQADAILRRSLAGVTAHSAKADILTPWKAHDRASREVYVSSGVPDPSVRRGVFGRVYNPIQRHLNSVEGVAPPIRNTNPLDTDTLLGRYEPRSSVMRSPMEEFDSPE